VGKLATMPLCLMKQQLPSQKFVCHAAVHGFVFYRWKNGLDMLFLKSLQQLECNRFIYFSL
jgi:hypothetical protein